MGQQVRDDQPGISRTAADVNRHIGPVPQGDDAMEFQGNGHPLVLADTAIVVGLEIGQLRLLIQGVGFQVQPGRVDVGGGDLHALRQRPLPNVGQQYRLPPVTEVHPVTGF